MKTKIYFIDGTELVIDVDFEKFYDELNNCVGFVRFGNTAIRIDTIKYIQEA